MTVLEEYKRTNEVGSLKKDDIKEHNKFNKIVALESEAQKEAQELINKKKKCKKWFEEEGYEILGGFWEINKDLTLKDIRELLPGVIEELKSKCK